jgi:GNAT superfamily N-acetyltransferase
MNILITESQLKLIEGRYIDFPVDSDISLEVWEDIDRLDLDSIVIPKSLRGQGIGTKIMNMVIDYSNSVNKPIYLTPSTSFGATSIERLKRFYKKFGFEKNKNPESRHTLVRNPN